MSPTATVEEGADVSEILNKLSPPEKASEDLEIWIRNLPGDCLDEVLIWSTRDQKLSTKNNATGSVAGLALWIGTEIRGAKDCGVLSNCGDINVQITARFMEKCQITRQRFGVDMVANRLAWWLIGCIRQWKPSEQSCLVGLRLPKPGEGNWIDEFQGEEIPNELGADYVVRINLIGCMHLSRPQKI